MIKVGSFRVEVFVSFTFCFDPALKRIQPMSNMKMAKGITSNTATLFGRCIVFLILKYAYNIFLYPSLFRLISLKTDSRRILGEG